jgi:hypothetical protein
MNTQTESKSVSKVSEAVITTENPMQERYCGEVAECVEVTAEAVFTARRHEVRAAARGTNGEQGQSIREEAGPIFVP